MDNWTDLQWLADTKHRPCMINEYKTVTPVLFKSNEYDLTFQRIAQWINLLLLCFFTPFFILVAFQGYKLNRACSFEVVVMIISACVNILVGVSDFAYCDDFTVILVEFTTSLILLYMFYRF
jgi:hypothetical protein